MDNVTIEINNLTKIYKLYNKPIDRLKETLHPMRKKYYKNFYALNDLSFNINKGDTIGILGKNGSGKSTLLKLITGVLTPTSGSINSNGKISALLELGAGFNPEMTGIENIYMNGTLMGYAKEEMDESLDNIIEFADIGEYINQQVKMYSSGMFIRLAFALSISVDPDILIVDEALAVGDMSFQLKCIDKIKDFKRQGKTIIFVSHDIYSVRNICERAIWINDGKIITLGNCEEVIDSYEKFMKKSDFVKAMDAKIDANESKETGNNKKANNALVIEDLKFFSNVGELASEFKTGDNVKIELEYEIFKDGLNNIAANLAIYDSLGSYVSSLNTKSDNYKLKNTLGKHKLILNFTELILLPGIYYIDVTFKEDGATENLDYEVKYRTFTIISKYKAEGLFLLDHKWFIEKGIGE
jgi:teichoic acid transport system ATP-binding protein